MTWKLCGRTGVDAGMILLTDPCYVVRDAEDLKYHPFESWAALSQHLPDGSQRSVQLTNQFGADIGVIVTNFGGDGVYPVFIDVDSDGLVRGVQLRFDGRPPRGAG